MNKKILSIAIIVGVAIIGTVVWGMKSGSSSSSAANLVGTIYYYGAECPHCKNINEFLEKNNIAEKVNFSKKEVWHDRANASEMTQAGAKCGIAKKDLGVPFIFDDGKCLIGEPDVKKFFSEKAGITQ